MGFSRKELPLCNRNQTFLPNLVSDKILWLLCTAAFSLPEP